jgi:hypothetical protein
MLFRSACLFIVAAAIAPTVALARSVSISQSFKGNPITITVDGSRFAGAISSLTLRNVEYVNSSDHGREIQSALQVDGLGECFNPTEAGSSADDGASRTSSVLISASNSGNVLTTETRAAFWLAPGKNYGRQCSPWTTATAAQNRTVLSDYLISRRTSFYGAAIPNLIKTVTTFTIPENRKSASIEALTGYLPPQFSVWFRYNPSSRKLEQLSGGGNQRTTSPVVVAVPGGQSAMAVISPVISSGTDRGYFHWSTFAGRTPTSKWSCVYDHGPISAGSKLTYTCLIAVGTIDEVLSALNAYSASRAR